MEKKKALETMTNQVSKNTRTSEMCGYLNTINTTSPK